MQGKYGLARSLPPLTGVQIGGVRSGRSENLLQLQAKPDPLVFQGYVRKFPEACRAGAVTLGRGGAHGGPATPRRGSARIYLHSVLGTITCHRWDGCGGSRFPISSGATEPKFISAYQPFLTQTHIHLPESSGHRPFMSEPTGVSQQPICENSSSCTQGTREAGGATGGKPASHHPAPDWT